MPNMEAIYFITPTEESITLLMNDFKKGSLYKAAHVYVTEGEQFVFLAPTGAQGMLIYVHLFSSNLSRALYHHFSGPDLQAALQALS